MRIQIDTSSLKQTRWHEFAVRFLLGGLITAATGIIGKKYGPSVGGLFLAFPVIFPASATLIDKHERGKKQGQAAGVRGCRRRGDGKRGSFCLCAVDQPACWRTRTLAGDLCGNHSLDRRFRSDLAGAKTNVRAARTIDYRNLRIRSVWRSDR
jgi:hypothetical protein